MIIFEHTNFPDDGVRKCIVIHHDSNGDDYGCISSDTGTTEENMNKNTYSADVSSRFRIAYPLMKALQGSDESRTGGIATLLSHLQYVGGQSGISQILSYSASENPQTVIEKTLPSSTITGLMQCAMLEAVIPESYTPTPQQLVKVYQNSVTDFRSVLVDISDNPEEPWNTDTGGIRSIYRLKEEWLHSKFWEDKEGGLEYVSEAWDYIVGNGEGVYVLLDSSGQCWAQTVGTREQAIERFPARLPVVRIESEDAYYPFLIHTNGGCNRNAIENYLRRIGALKAVNPV